MKHAALVMVLLAAPFSGAETPVSYSQFLEHVRSGEVASVTVKAQSGAALCRRNFGTVESSSPRCPLISEAS